MDPIQTVLVFWKCFAGFVLQAQSIAGQGYDERLDNGEGRAEVVERVGAVLNPSEPHRLLRLVFDPEVPRGFLGNETAEVALNRKESVKRNART